MADKLTHQRCLEMDLPAEQSSTASLVQLLLRLLSLQATARTLQLWPVAMVQAQERSCTSVRKVQPRQLHGFLKGNLVTPQLFKLQVLQAVLSSTEQPHQLHTRQQSLLETAPTQPHWLLETKELLAQSWSFKHKVQPQRLLGSLKDNLDTLLRFKLKVQRVVPLCTALLQLLQSLRQFLLETPHTQQPHLPETKLLPVQLLLLLLKVQQQRQSGVRKVAAPTLLQYKLKEPQVVRSSMDRQVLKLLQPRYLQETQHTPLHWLLEVKAARALSRLFSLKAPRPLRPMWQPTLQPILRQCKPVGQHQERSLSHNKARDTLHLHQRYTRQNLALMLKQLEDNVVADHTLVSPTVLIQEFVLLQTLTTVSVLLHRLLLQLLEVQAELFTFTRRLLPQQSHHTDQQQPHHTRPQYQQAAVFKERSLSIRHRLDTLQPQHTGLAPRLHTELPQQPAAALLVLLLNMIHPTPASLLQLHTTPVQRLHTRLFPLQADQTVATWWNTIHQPLVHRLLYTLDRYHTRVLRHHMQHKLQVDRTVLLSRCTSLQLQDIRQSPILELPTVERQHQPALWHNQREPQPELFRFIILQQLVTRQLHILELRPMLVKPLQLQQLHSPAVPRVAQFRSIILQRQATRQSHIQELHPTLVLPLPSALKRNPAVQTVAPSSCTKFRLDTTLSPLRMVHRLSPVHCLHLELPRVQFMVCLPLHPSA